MAADAQDRVIDAFVKGLDVNGLRLLQSVPAATGRRHYDPLSTLCLCNTPTLPTPPTTVGPDR